ncbi:MAG: 50S ribosomal protein L37e [Candidatus Aenigmarchaeota archaeon]|nr:50S ribosomal protein L37e [Candidatus Aenigmarchaeota archaeon]
MTKGTPSFGKKQKKTHVLCRRCGRHSFHASGGVCSACGFGGSKKIKKFKWQWKPIERNKRMK